MTRRRSLPAIPGATLHFVADDIPGVHEAMVTAAGGRTVWLVGGGDLVGQFADRGLLDDIILGVAPVMLGAGTPLLPRRLTSRSLTLTSVAQEKQFVHLTYEVTSPPRETGHPAPTTGDPNA